MKKILVAFILAHLFAAADGQSKPEEEAIKKLLEKESSTWRAGNIKGHADCWHIQPYSKILVSTGNGSVLDIPPDVMIHPSSGMVGKGGTSVNSNYKMNIHGNNAWVSHNEESTAADGKKTYSYEIRMLEKVNEQWKLVGQSIHISKSISTPATKTDSNDHH